MKLPAGRLKAATLLEAMVSLAIIAGVLSVSIPILSSIVRSKDLWGRSRELLGADRLLIEATLQQDLTGPGSALHIEEVPHPSLPGLSIRMAWVRGDRGNGEMAGRCIIRDR